MELLNLLDIINYCYAERNVFASFLVFFFIIFVITDKNKNGKVEKFFLKETPLFLLIKYILLYKKKPFLILNLCVTVFTLILGLIFCKIILQDSSYFFNLPRIGFATIFCTIICLFDRVLCSNFNAILHQHRASINLLITEKEVVIVKRNLFYLTLLKLPFIFLAAHLFLYNFISYWVRFGLYNNNTKIAIRCYVNRYKYSAQNKIPINEKDEKIMYSTIGRHCKYSDKTIIDLLIEEYYNIERNTPTMERVREAFYASMERHSRKRATKK